MTQWSVIEFDAARVVISLERFPSEGTARGKFHYVTERSQRSDVVQRARSAALLCDGQLVEATEIRPTRRAPWVGGQRFHELDPPARESLHRLDLLAARLALASLRVDGQPRWGPVWARVRVVACELWDTVRDPSSCPDVPARGWWLVEWSCGCVQAEPTRRAVHKSWPLPPHSRDPRPDPDRAPARPVNDRADPPRRGAGG